jgi:toxin ParE1/3/4
MMNVRLSAAADADFDNIWQWTAHRFGVEQAQTYHALLYEVLTKLASDRSGLLGRPREDLGPGLRTLHVSRGRHVIVFCIGESGGKPAIDVLRVLHDAMDLARHVADSRH